MKKCIQCKKEFAEKRVFSSCADCSLCPNICDNCQTIVNRKQEEAKEQLMKNPNKKFPVRAQTITIELSQEYPLLIKRTLLLMATRKQVEDYCHYKAKNGLLFINRPRNEKEWELMEKQIASTKKWIDFSQGIKENRFIDLCEVEVELNLCDKCRKTKETIEIPFLSKPEGKIEQPFRMCYNCLHSFRLDGQKYLNDSGTDPDYLKQAAEFLTIAEELENLYPKEKNENQ